MEPEFITNTINIIIKSSVTMICLIIVAGVVKLFFFRVQLENQSDQDDEFKPNNEPPELSFTDKLNKEMEEAGVDNLHDLERYKENKNHS